MPPKSTPTRKISADLERSLREFSVRLRQYDKAALDAYAALQAEVVPGTTVANTLRPETPLSVAVAMARGLRKASRFKPGRRPGATGTLSKWIAKSLRSYPAQTPRLRWNALLGDALNNRNGVALAPKVSGLRGTSIVDAKTGTVVASSFDSFARALRRAKQKDLSADN
jgi:hypothetical protein